MNDEQTNGDGSGLGVGMIVGILIAILLIVLLVVFLPRLGGSTTQNGTDSGIEVPDEIDVNINTEGQ